MDEILVNEKWMIPAHSKEEFQTRMPKIGDRMLVKAESSGYLEADRWAEVVAVYPRALYYIVRYSGLGFTEALTVVPAPGYKATDKKYGLEQRRKNRRK